MIRGAILLAGLCLTLAVKAQQTVPSSEILHDLKGLKNATNILYVAAHPDDENTRLIAYLTRHEHFDVSYLSLTRGDGGQNLIGTEIGEQLGLIRTHELLAARGIDKGHQYFSRAVDFGYSKTPEETFKFWDREKVLSDVVWVIRNVQPDVIITRFSPRIEEGRSTHGHHTASAMLAREAFTAAADPNRFPEQLEYVDVWKTNKLYWNTSYWFYGSVEEMEGKVAQSPEKYVKVDVNAYLPKLGRSGSDISSASRSQHKSQGFGSSPTLDEQWEYMELLEGEMPEGQMDPGIPDDWKAASLGSKLDKLIDKVIGSFDLEHPENSIPDLFEIRDAIAQMENKNLQKRKLAEIHKIIARCAGIKVNAYASEQRVFAGQKVKSTLHISSHADQVSVLSVATRMDGKKYLDEMQLVKPSLSLEVEWVVPDVKSQPYWLSKEKKEGLYTVDNQQLIGKAYNDYPFFLGVEIQIGAHKFMMDLPLEYGSTDPVKGQVVEPHIVTPDVMLNLDREVYVFAQKGQQEIGVEVISGKPGMAGYVELVLPQGWGCSPAFIKTNFEKAGVIKRFNFKVTPPESQSEGQVRAIFKTEDNVYSLGIHQLNYDHIPKVALFPGSESKIVRLDLKKEGDLVGYVTGAGDKVPESIAEMGYTVEILSVNDLLQNDLSGYQAIVIGIRALNTLDDIGSTNEPLSAYVKAGGNLIMQYNTSHRLKSQPLGPYEIKLSRDRVTEEDAEVKILKPMHKVLSGPNKIVEADFDGWVQERGLYFPNEWSEEMEAILGMHDSGESEKQGSLLVGSYGDGYIVYTGISFFRELPAGVPGAYRLLANILSL